MADKGLDWIEVNGTPTVKYLDTSVSLQLLLTLDSKPFDLSRASKLVVNIANDSGFVLEKDIDLTSINDLSTGIVEFDMDNEIMDNLTPDEYELEVWATVKPVSIQTTSNTATLTIMDSQLVDHTAIFPSDGVLPFTIDENLTQLEGSSIKMITLEDFEARFNEVADKLANAVGPKGDTGPQGIQGPKGEQGTQGIQGPKGDTGEQGPKGDKGDTGDAGPQGEVGPQGIQGEVGPQGIQGEQGNKGDKGDTGQGIEIKGSVDKPESLPANGNDGDTYMIGPALYVWSNGSWNNVGNIQGPKGRDGFDGVDALPNLLTSKYINGGIIEKGSWGYVVQEYTPVKADETYTLSVKVNEQSTAKANVTLTAIDANGTSLIRSQNQAFSIGERGMASTSITIPEDTDHLEVWVGVADTDGQLVFDAATLVRNIVVINGVDGKDGKDGKDGAIGPQGIQGVQGPKGDQGPQGDRGPQGADGKSGSVVQYSGNVNDLKTDGRYYVLNSANTPDPTIRWFVDCYSNTDNSIVKQIGYGDNYNEFYDRTFRSGKWSDWFKRLATVDNDGAMAKIKADILKEFYDEIEPLKTSVNGLGNASLFSESGHDVKHYITKDEDYPTRMQEIIAEGGAGTIFVDRRVKGFPIQFNAMVDAIIIYVVTTNGSLSQINGLAFTANPSPLFSIQTWIVSGGTGQAIDQVIGTTAMVNNQTQIISNNRRAKIVIESGTDAKQRLIQLIQKDDLTSPKSDFGTISIAGDAVNNTANQNLLGLYQTQKGVLQATFQSEDHKLYSVTATKDGVSWNEMASKEYVDNVTPKLPDNLATKEYVDNAIPKLPDNLATKEYVDNATPKLPDNNLLVAQATDANDAQAKSVASPNTIVWF